MITPVCGCVCVCQVQSITLTFKYMFVLSDTLCSPLVHFSPNRAPGSFEVTCWRVFLASNFFSILIHFCTDVQMYCISQTSAFVTSVWEGPSAFDIKNMFAETFSHLERHPPQPRLCDLQAGPSHFVPVRKKDRGEHSLILSFISFGYSLLLISIKQFQNGFD